MSSLTLADLVANRTMSAEMAATLAVAAEERRSALFVAIPRMAGKSTVAEAMLRFAPEGVPQHRLSRDSGPRLGIPAVGDGSYLLMSEVSQAGFSDYLWGEDVRTVFRAVAEHGFGLVTALHAGGLEQAFSVLTRENEVPDEHAAALDLMVYVRSIGEWRNPTRRAVAAVYEIERVAAGRPKAILLHRWAEAADRFETVDAPLRIGSVAHTYEKHLESFRAGSPR
jgi:type IV secretory pathway ATPase VirB11/archaellum biosynthesis ATPase